MTVGDLDPLPRLLIEPLVRSALAEDLGPNGDVTTQSTVPSDAQARVKIAARKDGRVAGASVAQLVFAFVDPALLVTIEALDGMDVPVGGTIAIIEGPARSILQGERVALNFLGHLCGIATATRSFVRAIEGTKARICCTRKTTPGLRALEKYAVRAGGGVNHRFGLGDAILIKDNHLAISGGITAAVTRARAYAGHMMKIEVEIDKLDQLDEAIASGADVIMLDNMSLDDMRAAVARASGGVTLEASGNVTLERVRAIADTGVDLISVGWITHSAPNLDLGLDFLSRL